MAESRGVYLGVVAGVDVVAPVGGVKEVDVDHAAHAQLCNAAGQPDPVLGAHYRRLSVNPTWVKTRLKTCGFETMQKFYRGSEGG